MSKRTFGILTGIVGSALGAWYWAKGRGTGLEAGGLTPSREQGTVIFDNTPTAVESESI